MEDEDTYYYMTHATYLTYEYQLRDPDFWHESLKNKNNQQQSTIVKVEDLSTLSQQQPIEVKEEELSTPNGGFDLRVESVVLDGGELDVYVCLVDCLKHDSATTTSTINSSTGCDTDEILVCKKRKILIKICVKMNR